MLLRGTTDFALADRSLRQANSVPNDNNTDCVCGVGFFEFGARPAQSGVVMLCVDACRRQASDAVSYCSSENSVRPMDGLSPRFAVDGSRDEQSEQKGYGTCWPCPEEGAICNSTGIRFETMAIGSWHDASSAVSRCVGAVRRGAAACAVMPPLNL